MAYASQTDLTIKPSPEPGRGLRSARWPIHTHCPVSRPLLVQALRLVAIGLVPSRCCLETLLFPLVGPNPLVQEQVEVVEHVLDAQDGRGARRRADDDVTVLLGGLPPGGERRSTALAQGILDVSEREPALDPNGCHRHLGVRVGLPGVRPQLSGHTEVSKLHLSYLPVGDGMLEK